MNKFLRTARATCRPLGRLRAASVCGLSLVLAACAGPQVAIDRTGPSPLIVRTSGGQDIGPVDRPGARTQPVPAPPAPVASSSGSRAGAPAFRPPADYRPRGPTTMLNFVEADLQGVVRALAAFTERNFVVDPRVRGPLTLVSEVPVDADTAYAMLLAALRMQGFAVADVDGILRVVPEADAKVQGVPVGGEASAGVSRSGELVTRVFPLRYESAAQLVPILRPMIAPNNTINAYPGNNTLIITDYADNLERIARVIAEVDTSDAFSTDVVPVHYGVALDVAALAAQLLSGQGRNDPTGQVVVVADPRSNAVLLRAASPDKLRLARDLIRRIDRPETGGGNLHVVYLRNAQATRLAEVLRGALGGAGASAGESGGWPTMAAGLSGADQGGLGDDPNGLSSTPAALASAGMGGFGSQGGFGGQGVQSGLGGLGGGARSLGGGSGLSQPVAFSAGGATIQADPATNTLIISAPPPLYRNLREIIDQLDQRRAQVLVESLIVEVSAEDAAEFGIQWMVGGADIASGRSSFIGGANLGGSGFNRTGLTTIDALGQGLSLGVVKGTVNVLGNQLVNLGALARAMESRGNTNVLATPNLMTLDNEEASIMVGQTLPMVTGRYTTTGDGAGNPFQTIAREDVGLTLRIRPQISEGNTVKLALYQEVSSVDAATSNLSQGLVTTRKRAVETDVLVDDGQIIVLGGLLEDNLFDGRRSVPVLGDIPVLGQLFRQDTVTRRKTNLMVFLRPHIVRTARDSASIALDRYNYMRATQAQLPPLSSWLSHDADALTLPELEPDSSTGLLDLRDAGSGP